MIREIQEIVSELDRLRSELGNVNAKLGRLRHPVRSGLEYVVAYFLIPVALLVAAHVLVTIVLNVTPIYLRLASVIIPLPFGLAFYAREKVGIRGAVLLGVVIATFAILCMLTVTGLNDNVPIVPGPWIEWREAIEYASTRCERNSAHDQRCQNDGMKQQRGSCPSAGGRRDSIATDDATPLPRPLTIAGHPA